MICNVRPDCSRLCAEKGEAVRAAFGERRPGRPRMGVCEEERSDYGVDASGAPSSLTIVATASRSAMVALVTWVILTVNVSSGSIS